MLSSNPKHISLKIEHTAHTAPGSSHVWKLIEGDALGMTDSYKQVPVILQHTHL